MISRRIFLSLALSLFGGWPFGQLGRAFGASFPHFFFTQLKYKGGDWDPNPLFVNTMAEEIELRTSIDARTERRVIALSDPDLFYSPFLYMAGRDEFDPFTKEEREVLTRFLTYGGFLFAEDTGGAGGTGFDRAFRREMAMILPNYPLKRLPPDHSLYQSFYLIRNLGGRRQVNSFVEGVSIDNWTPVVYSQNDLSGAWSRDRYGKWVNECHPGGELQRKAAFMTGINIVIYCLTSDYKKDLIHHPFIKSRQKT